MKRFNTLQGVFGLHVLGNAALLVLIYQWLDIRDARAWQIAWTLVLGIAIVSGALCLHAGTCHWFRTRSWRVPGRTVFKFAAGVLLFVLAWWLLDLIPRDFLAQWTASALTLQTRKPISPEMTSRICNAVIWLLRWFFVPLLLFRKVSDRRFWLLLAVVLLISVYIPQLLVHWRPLFQGTAMEISSMIVRWSAAYGLTIAGWLALLRYVARKSTDVTPLAQ